MSAFVYCSLQPLLSSQASTNLGKYNQISVWSMFFVWPTLQKGVMNTSCTNIMNCKVLCQHVISEGEKTLASSSSLV